MPDHTSVTGATRAGVATHALKSLFTGTPAPEGTEENRERPFDVQAADFPSLLMAFLNHAVTDARGNAEIYDDISFSLLTDKQAKGKFVGRPAQGFVQNIQRVSVASVEKNPEGQWVAKLELTK